MKRIYRSVLELVGNTPLVALERYAAEQGLEGTLLAKVERGNPGGSVKDRVAVHMLDTAEAEGKLRPGAVIIEPTSGNTGVGLAMAAAVRGYRMIVTMPETMSVERRKLIAAYGAQIVLTPGSEGMSGAVRRAEELQAEIPGSWIASQFDNPANPAAHENTTGPELWRDTDGQIDAFVAGVGTGGTLSGTARYLKNGTRRLRSWPSNLRPPRCSAAGMPESTTCRASVQTSFRKTSIGVSSTASFP